MIGSAVALVAVTAVHTWAAPDTSADPRVFSLTSTAFTAVCERLDGLSFRYRSLPFVGRIPAANVSGESEALLAAEASPGLSQQLSDGEWGELVERSRKTWHSQTAREFAEIVREVDRGGTRWLDADPDLLASHVVRPTATASFVSREARVLWSPLSNSLVLGAGGVTQTERPGSAFMLPPSILAMPGVQKSYDVHVETVDHRTVLSLKSRRSPGSEYRFEVSETIGWLPTRCTVRSGGEVSRICRYRWMSAPEIGTFPALVEEVTISKDFADFAITAFSAPRASTGPLPLLPVPPGTTVADTRRTPTVVTTIQAGVALQGDWDQYFKIGPPLPIPEFKPDRPASTAKPPMAAPNSEK